MKIAFLILGILSLLYLLLVFLISPSSRKHKSLKAIDGKFIAHRGLHDENLPENSLGAFQTAAEKGYPIEIDLHLTKDGNVVVFHDDSLKRMCGDDRKVCESTLEELKNHKLLNSEETIPTFKECLDTVGGKVPLLIEFKLDGNNTKALCRAADLILSGYQGDYLIQSFYPQVVRWYKIHRKQVCRGQLSCNFRKKGFIKWLSGNLLLNFMGRPHFVSYKHSDASKAMFRFSVWLGAYPIGWTFRTKKELKISGSTFRTWIFEKLDPNIND